MSGHRAVQASQARRLFAYGTGFPRRVAAVLLCLSAPATFGPDPAALAQPASEQQLKAAFFYRFPQFVQWPPPAVQAAATMDLCLAKPAPMADDLRVLAAGESLRGRPLRVREIGDAAGLTGCHALFAGADADGGRSLLRAARDRPILTVGEDDRFLTDGGIIAFRVLDRRVRFEVDLAHARRAGLRLDVQLLRLARAVHGGPAS
jgi:hypothetical protein